MTYDKDGYPINDDGSRMTVGQLASISAGAGTVAVAPSAPVITAARESSAVVDPATGYPVGYVNESGNLPNRRQFIRNQRNGIYNAALASQGLDAKIAQGDARIEQGNVRLQLEEQRANANQANADRTAATNEARLFHDVSKTAFEQSNSRKVETEAGQFLALLKDLGPHDADYDEKIGGWAAALPHALSSDSVKEALALRAGQRKDYLAVAGKGGPSEFADVAPAADAYTREFSASNDIHRARAAAIAVKAGEAQVRAQFNAGNLLPSDLDWGDQLTTSNPHFVTKGPHAGSIDYAKLLSTASKRAGGRTSANQANANPILAELKATHGLSPEQVLNPLELHAGALDKAGNWTNKTLDDKGKPTGYTGSNESPDDILRLNTGKTRTEKLKGGGEKQVAAPVYMKRSEYEAYKAAASAARPDTSKPKTIVQNGHTYTLGADGQYH